MRDASVARGDAGAAVFVRAGKAVWLLLRARHESDRHQHLHPVHERRAVRRRLAELQLWLLRSVPRQGSGGRMSLFNHHRFATALLGLVGLLAAAQGCNDGNDGNPKPPDVGTSGSSTTGGKSGSTAGSSNKGGESTDEGGAP